MDKLGSPAGTHDRIRKGTDLNQVISHLERLREIKAEKKTPQPAVHLADLMLRSNFHLTLVVDPELSAEAIFNDTERADHYRNALETIKAAAASEGIVFDYHGPGLDGGMIEAGDQNFGESFQAPNIDV